jgi:hypothetical protein
MLAGLCALCQGHSLDSLENFKQGSLHLTPPLLAHEGVNCCP